MLKRRKRNVRSRWKTVFLLVLTSLFVVMIGPLVWRMQLLKQAKSAYDIQKVQEELVWIEKNASWLEKLKIIRDTKLWLALNVGSKDIDELELSTAQDEKHQFWLCLFYMQEGKLTDAQNVLGRMSESSLKVLGNGLISISKGDAQETIRLLTLAEKDWKSLTIDEQTIRHLALAQAAMIEGDKRTTQNEMQAAQDLNPNNPAYLSMAFDVALKEQQWEKAIELRKLIDAQTWRPANALYETKKALIAIYEGNTHDLSQSLAALEELPQGDACLNYVNGIKVLEEGDLDEGKNLLERALKSGLEGEIKTDAQRALDQIKERQKADQSLRAVVAQTSEQW